ncbi:hypothetical protein SLS63_010604 [Diaporthe eres]|uniref:Methylisocitrate lyase n=1 Tax=Diaporthe eres TaxID=83184 RepID=A0ABR1NWE1_DIAER
MSKSIVNTNPYPFHFEASKPPPIERDGQHVTISLAHSRGRIPSLQASKVRALMQEAHGDSSKILAHVCSYDALSSRLCEEAGFPVIFLSGFAMSSALGLPDTGYIAFQEVAAKVQEVVRETTAPVIVDGDTGYGSPMNVRRTVAGDEGQDIWILARTDSLILGYDEALARATKAIEIGVDAVFVEALPDRETMARLRKDLDFPLFANIIEGGKTDNLSAQELGELGFSAVAYPWTLVAAKLRSIRETLEAIKGSFTVGKPPTILSYAEVCEGVGFDKYFALEERYQYEGRTTGQKGHQWED